MIPIRNKTKEIIGLLVILGIIAFTTIFLFTRSLTQALTSVGTIVSFTIYPSYFYFEKIGWRQRLFRLGGWLCQTPDLRGRWEGEINRGDKRGPHKFILEIRQTLEHIQCETYSSRGCSNSFMAGIVSDPQSERFKLIYYWIGKAGILEEHELYEPGLFYGTTILDYIKGKKKRSLEGEYFTNRSPKQTKGTLKLKWAGYNLYSKFLRNNNK